MRARINQDYKISGVVFAFDKYWMKHDFNMIFVRNSARSDFIAVECPPELLMGRLQCYFSNLMGIDKPAIGSFCNQIACLIKSEGMPVDHYSSSKRRTS